MVLTTVASRKGGLHTKVREHPNEVSFYCPWAASLLLIALRKQQLYHMLAAGRMKPLLLSYEMTSTP